MDEHLAKAEQFLAAAEFSLDSGMADAAASNSVHAGIQACDAIRAARDSTYTRGKNHTDAIPILRQAGAEGRTAATLLGRLLAIKSKAEYDTTAITMDAARRTVDNARRLLSLAKGVRAG